MSRQHHWLRVAVVLVVVVVVVVACVVVVVIMCVDVVVVVAHRCDHRRSALGLQPEGGGWHCQAVVLSDSV